MLENKPFKHNNTSVLLYEVLSAHRRLMFAITPYLLSVYSRLEWNVKAVVIFLSCIQLCIRVEIYSEVSGRDEVEKLMMVKC